KKVSEFTACSALRKLLSWAKIKDSRQTFEKGDGMMARLDIKNLHVSIEDKEILKGVDLVLNTGEIHAIMGPNGTGKSTLAAAIIGHPSYQVTEGEILLDGQNVLEMAVDERARAGLFLGVQYPSEIAGITNAEFMRAAINARRPEDDKISVMQFIKK